MSRTCPITLTRARAAGATVLVQPYTSDGRQAAMVQFAGGNIAEFTPLMHAAAGFLVATIRAMLCRSSMAKDPQK